jgi:drug/metabolite transporter (DMT)-like permease
VKASPPLHDDLKRGALLMIGSGLLFAVMGAIIKKLSATLPNEMIVFFRNAVGLAVLMPWVLHRGWRTLKTSRPRGHLVRSLFGVAAMYCFFYAIAHLPLAEATVLNYSTPLFVPFIAWLWLSEPVPPVLRWILAVGFLGVALILKPGHALFTAVSLVGLASGLFAAVAMVGVRSLARSEPTTRIVFYFTLVGCAVSVIPLLWAWRAPPIALWGWLAAMGTAASAAQLLMTRAYASAPAAQVGPFAYSTAVFAALIGWLLWAEGFDVLSLAGAMLIAVAGALTIRRTARAPTPV